MHTLTCRVFSVLLLSAACQLLACETSLTEPLQNRCSASECALQFVALLAVAAFVWFRPKQVVATDAGLQVGSGKKRRVIAWSRVIDVRELPWHRLGPGWSSCLWQVDLDKDERFDFCGTRSARTIVAEYIERAERREPLT